jgi:hypothetical protein
MRNNLSRDLRDRLIKALKETTKIYQGWNALIAFLVSVASTYLVFILHEQFILPGAVTIFSEPGLFYFIISNILIFILSFLTYFFY